MADDSVLRIQATLPRRLPTWALLVPAVVLVLPATLLGAAMTAMAWAGGGAASALTMAIPNFLPAAMFALAIWGASRPPRQESVFDRRQRLYAIGVHTFQPSPALEGTFDDILGVEVVSGHLLLRLQGGGRHILRTGDADDLEPLARDLRTFLAL